MARPTEGVIAGDARVGWVVELETFGLSHGSSKRNPPASRPPNQPSVRSSSAVRRNILSVAEESEAV